MSNYTREQGMAMLSNFAMPLDERVKKSHYILCRAGGMSHLKAWLRCYAGIDQDSGLYWVPLVPRLIYWVKRLSSPTPGSREP